jgi:hypothetical protein
MAPLQQRTHQCLRGHACLITRRKTPLIDVINELTAHFAPFSTKTLGQTSKIISIVELLRMQTPIATWKYSRQINATWNNFEFPPNNNKCHVDLILSDPAWRSRSADGQTIVELSSEFVDGQTIGTHRRSSMDRQSFNTQTNSSVDRQSFNSLTRHVEDSPFALCFVCPQCNCNLLALD